MSFESINSVGIKPKIYPVSGIRMQCSGISADSPALVCKISADGICSPATCLHGGLMVSTNDRPVYVYESGTLETVNNVTYGRFAVLGAVGMVEMTLAANASCTAGGVVLLDANGTVIQCNGSPGELTTGEALLGYFLENKETSTAPQTVYVLSSIAFLNQPI